MGFFSWIIASMKISFHCLNITWYSASKLDHWQWGRKAKGFDRMTTLIDIQCIHNEAVSLVPGGSSILLQRSKQHIQKAILPYQPYAWIALESYIKLIRLSIVWGFWCFLTRFLMRSSTESGLVVYNSLISTYYSFPH